MKTSGEHAVGKPPKTEKRPMKN